MIGARIIVCGGRYYNGRATLNLVLDGIGPSEIAEGGATGADTMAAAWAWRNGRPRRTYKANWELYGRSAGPRRNAEMLADFKPDAVVAFPGGKGTQNMIDQARRRGVPVIEVGDSDYD